MGCHRCLPCARRGFLTGCRKSEGIQREKNEEKQPINKKGAEFNNTLCFLVCLSAKTDKVSTYALFLLRNNKHPRPSSTNVAGSGIT